MDITAVPTPETPSKLASRKFPSIILYGFVGTVITYEAGELFQCRHLSKNLKYQDAWGIYFVNEIGRLYQGMKGRVEETNTMLFITKEEVPQN